MASQVNYSGELAELVVLGTTIAFWLTVAWLFKELVELVVEWVITTPFISSDRYDAHLLRLVSRVISAIGILLIVLVGAEQIGIPALGLLATASVGGLVVGLAAQSTIENLIGGMTLFADKPFEVGDFVGFGEDNGTVEEIGPRSTRIRKLNGTQLTVPNSDIVQARISNFTQRNNALFLHTIGVRYETTLEQIERLVARIGEGLRAHPMVEKDDDMPRVRLAAFGASSIDIETRAYVETTSVHEFMAVQEELLSMIMRQVEAAGTGMAFPSTTAYLTRDAGIEGPGALEEESRPPRPRLQNRRRASRSLRGRRTTRTRPPGRTGTRTTISVSPAGEGKWRRGRDSNPRCFRTPLFESGTLNHSDTSPGRRESSKASRDIAPARRSLAAHALGGQVRAQLRGFILEDARDDLQPARDTWILRPSSWPRGRRLRAGPGGRRPRRRRRKPAAPRRTWDRARRR